MQTIIESQTKTEKPHKRYAAILLAIVAALLVLINSTALSSNPNNSQLSIDELQIATVTKGDLIKTVRAPGNLIAKNRQWLSARVSAKVSKRLLEPGAIVTPESIILQLTSPELTQQFKRVQIDYSVAQAKLNALKELQVTEMQKKEADVKLLTIEKQQATEDAAAKKALHIIKIIPTYRYREAVLRQEKLTLQLEIAQFELEQLPRLQASLLKVEHAKVEQQLLQLTLLAEQVELLNVRAQMHGILQSIAVEEGQEIAKGTELARVADQNNLKAELRIQESQAKDIAIGQHVEIDTRRSKVIGTVSRIDPAVVNGTVTIDVNLPKVLPSEARPDLRVNGIIEITRIDNILLLDKPAHWQEQASISLFKLTGDSQAVKTTVFLGEYSTSSIQLLSGLKEGEQVIISDLAHLAHHQSLTLN
ncbi:efflux RND transporter periplasmic adaptor subunit [Colwelliaceae bacterium 6441]